MKALIDGVWHGDIADTPELRARRVEEKKLWFRGVISADGATGFKAEPGRYHLYVSHACPWAHRTMIVRALKGLEKMVTVSVADPRWSGPDGWVFGSADDGPVTRDHVNGAAALYQIYQAAKLDFTGKVTVPVLWDKKTGTIVNNESAEIAEMFNSAFNQWAEGSIDLFPVALCDEVTALSGEIVEHVSMGVYKAGFANDQAAYDKAVATLFEQLDALDARLASGGPYLLGEPLTMADIHLFATLVRFDAVYHTALRCSLKRLIDYPALAAHTRRIHELPDIAETVYFDHMKRHYHDDLGLVRPEIMAAGPARDFRHI